MNDYIYILQKNKTGEVINVYDKIPSEDTLDEDYCEFLELSETFYGAAYMGCHMIKWNPTEGLKPYYIKPLPEMTVKK
jgi:hypothetical protein